MVQFKKIWAEVQGSDIETAVANVLKQKDDEIKFYKNELELIKEEQNDRNNKIHKNKKAEIKS